MRKQDVDLSWTSEEKHLLESLPRTSVPPFPMEKKIMQELKDRGLLHSDSRPSVFIRLAAALIVLFIGGTAGYLIGSGSTGATNRDTQTLPRFVLLLHEIPNPSMDETPLVAEYSAWAGGVYEGGRFVTGEKLKDSGRLLTSSDGKVSVADEGIAREGEIMSGYFIIEAVDYDEAVRVASTCPHLKYGGRIELREIDPT